ncbi:MAG: hypothetical protein ACIALR_06630, partial [Blastopirellula sp. JB062]
MGGAKGRDPSRRKSDAISHGLILHLSGGRFNEISERQIEKFCTCCRQTLVETGKKRLNPI